MSLPDDSGQQNFDLLFRHTADGVIIIGIDDVVTQVNAAATALFSLTLAEWRKKKIEIAFAKTPQLLAHLKKKQAFKAELHLGKKRAVSLQGFPIAQHQRMVIVRETTEKRILETRRDALIHSIAHDLRNPLAAANGYIDLIDKLGELDTDQKQYLGKAQNTIQRLYESLNELIDLAWLEAGIPLDHVVLQLEAPIRNAIKSLEAAASQKKVTFVISIQEPLPPIMGDAKRLQQAIYNLIHNALLYSYAGSIVVIHAWGDAREVIFSVADQGIGIARKELDTIFDRFYRSQDERVKALQGNGLGLTVAKRIITIHAGTLWVNSALESGSKFSFAIPSLER